MIDTFAQPLPHGITLSCRSAGTRGRPTLMFLHGFPEGAFVWDPLLEHFANPAHGGYFCVAPYLRGFGESSAPADPAAYRARHLVQDIAALIAACAGTPEDATGKGRLACLVAHDWGGALAWNLANQRPELMERLAILNSPHPATFLRELKFNPRQQAASRYMNFLVRPDAERLLAEDDFRRLWQFLTKTDSGVQWPAWLTDELRGRYRALWSQGLTGGCNYYRASPLRPADGADPGAAHVELPPAMLTVDVPTLVLWGLRDIALLPELTDGLQAYVQRLSLQRLADASHWIVHEQPQRVIASIEEFLDSA